MHLCLIIPLDGHRLLGHRPVDPGYGVDIGGHPDQGLPPEIPNPPPGQPGHLPSVPPGWPVRPAHPIGRPPMHHPDQGLPAIPGVPDNSLPTNPPPQVPPGMVVVMIRTPDGKWRWAAIPAPSLPTPLPEPPPVATPKV